VGGGGNEFVEDPQIRTGLVGRHLDRRRPMAEGASEEPAGGRGVPLLRRA
jgi:hypothetical protein